MRKLLWGALVVSAGLALYQRWQATRDDERLWTQATTTADLR